MAEISKTNVRLDHNNCEHIIIRIENVTVRAEEETFGFIRLKITPLSFVILCFLAHTSEPSLTIT